MPILRSVVAMSKPWTVATLLWVFLFGVAELLANWSAAHYKLHLGQVAIIPVGSFVLPISLFIRDQIQRKHPAQAVVLAGAVGFLVSCSFGEQVFRIAIASVIAYVFCFLTDTYVFTKTAGLPIYTRLRRSNWAALPVDTFVFVPIAFAGLYPLGPIIVGQLVTKLLITEVALVMIRLWQDYWNEWRRLQQMRHHYGR